MRRTFLAGVASAILAGLTVASAAGFAVANGTLAAGGDADLQCDEGGVTVNYVLSGANVTGATVSGIDPDCKGATLRVFFDISPEPDQSGFVGIGPASSYNFSLTPAVPASSIVGLTVVMAGHDQEDPP